MAGDPERNQAIESKYDQILPRLEKLATEARFIVDSELESMDLKVQGVTQRVKTKKSVQDKMNLKQLDPDEFSNLTDLVGLRIVALFLGDLSKIVKLISEKFNIVKQDDWVTAVGSEDAFGYMSIHLDVCLKDEYVGPRYDSIKDLTFEIQIRTILMDAWANVSHYLDYKGPSSIPEDLRRDFYALSGLFYVADKHFEIFYGESESSQREAVKIVAHSDTADVRLNLDTLAALLRSKFPDRIQDERQKVSEMVEELSAEGFETIAEIERLLSDQAEYVLENEEDNPLREPGKLFYSQVGVIRVSLKGHMKSAQK